MRRATAGDTPGTLHPMRTDVRHREAAAGRGSTGRRVRWSRAAFPCLLAALILAATPGPAAAHIVWPDFVSEVRGLTPAAPGVEVRMLGSDRRLEIRDPGHHTVVVLGYDGEPFARILPDGSAQVNVRSPATYLNRNRTENVVVPPEADPTAAPVWRTEATDGRLEWHDHRSHWMGSGIPSQVEHTTDRTKIFDYGVPIVVDGRRTAIVGTLYWAGRPDRPPVLGALAFILAPIGLGVLGLLWMLRRMDQGAGDGLPGPMPR